MQCDQSKKNRKRGTFYFPAKVEFPLFAFLPFLLGGQSPEVNTSWDFRLISDACQKVQQDRLGRGKPIWSLTRSPRDSAGAKQRGHVWPDVPARGDLPMSDRLAHAPGGLGQLHVRHRDFRVVPRAAKCGGGVGSRVLSIGGLLPRDRFHLIESMARTEILTPRLLGLGCCDGRCCDFARITENQRGQVSLM